MTTGAKHALDDREIEGGAVAQDVDLRGRRHKRVPEPPEFMQRVGEVHKPAWIGCTRGVLRTAALAEPPCIRFGIHVAQTPIRVDHKECSAPRRSGPKAMKPIDRMIASGRVDMFHGQSSRRALLIPAVDGSGDPQHEGRGRVRSAAYLCFPS